MADKQDLKDRLFEQLESIYPIINPMIRLESKPKWMEETWERVKQQYPSDEKIEGYIKICKGIADASGRRGSV